MLVRVECKNGHVWFMYYGEKYDDPRCETCGDPIEIANKLFAK